MISAIIAAGGQERALARSLAALVPAAVEGLVADAIVVDPARLEGNRLVTEAAGCALVADCVGIAEGLRIAARQARAPWLLFLSAGMVFDSGWERQAAEFIEEVNASDRTLRRAALFLERGGGAWVLGGLLARLIGPRLVPAAGTGLLLSAAFYAALDGHPAKAADASRDLARRIGRRRLTLLRQPLVREAY